MTTNSGGVRGGLALLTLLSVFDVVFSFVPVPEGEVGPPIEVQIAGGVLGLISLVLIVLVWRGGRGVLGWLLVASRVLSALLGVPAYFEPGVPTWAIVLVSTFLVLTIIGCVLVRPILSRTKASA